MRISPKNITELKPNEIFVFGSNKHGHHNGGAARFACEKFGAIYGVGKGLQGQCYAINTMSGWTELKYNVMFFIEQSQKSPSWNFLVTEIGCGIAGWKIEQVAPLFKGALEIENIYLPERFVKYLNA